MKYRELTLGQIEDIVDKLGGMEGVKRFLSGEMATERAEREFKIWKTIKLGTGPKTGEDFYYSLCEKGFNISDRASDILGKAAFSAASEESELNLVKVTVGEMDFKRGARRDKIYVRAEDFGLELCPAEVGPQLRLQDQDQPNGERIIVAMEPIIDSYGKPRVFCVECHNSELRLEARWGHSGYFWDAGIKLVFCYSRR